MDSAFGIDHGEIDKALFPGGGRRRREQAAVEYRAERAAAGKRRRTAAAGKLRQLSDTALNTKVSVADVGRTATKPIVRMGNLAAKHPGATGVAALGAGGYAVHRANQRKDLPKRRS